MTFRLDEQVVIVTGGTRGIGRALVLEALDRGARVVFCGRTLGDASASLLAECEGAGAAERVRAVAADVASEAEVDALFDATLEAFGRVDAVVNNAGISRDTLLVHHETEDWDAVIATNLTGPFLTSRRAISEFLAQGDGGRIVSIGSLSQQGARSQASYAASKGALLGLTRTIAKEYGRKSVYANLVVAGYVETELSTRMPDFAKQWLIDHSSLRRKADPAEIARVALFLASPSASFINGEAIHATGGLIDIPL